MPRVGTGLARSGLARLTCRERRDPFRSGKHRVGTFVTHATDVSDGGAPMTGRLGIDDVTPSVGDGRHPSKAVVGEVIPVRATVWREGHDAVAANVVWKRLGSTAQAEHVRMLPDGVGTDRFVATVVPDEPGLWTFRVDAWSDPWATWRHAVEAKL